MRRYDTFTFVNDCLDYLKANLNTIITSDNSAYQSNLLKDVPSENYVYFTENLIDELGADACVLYNTPITNSVQKSGAKSAMTKAWQVGIAYAEGIRDMDIKNLEKILRYETCLQQALDSFFNKTGYCSPEIVNSTVKAEADDNNIYRFAIFDINFTIAGT